MPQPQANNIDKEKVRIIGMRTVEGLLREIEKKGKKYRQTTKGEKKILRDLGPLLFTQGFIWTLDNVAVQDDPRCATLEKHLRTFAEHYSGTGLLEDIPAIVAATDYLVELDKQRELAEQYEREKREQKQKDKEEKLLPAESDNDQDEVSCNNSEGEDLGGGGEMEEELCTSSDKGLASRADNKENIPV